MTPILFLFTLVNAQMMLQPLFFSTNFEGNGDAVQTIWNTKYTFLYISMFEKIVAMDTFGNILLKDGVSPKNRENSEKFQTWATFQYTKLDSDTHVIANVVCKIQGFEFLQNIQNCEVINDYISNDLYYIFIIYKVTKKVHLIQLNCAIHATYFLLTD